MLQQNLYVLDSSKKTIGVLSNNLPNSLPFIDDKQERDLDSYVNTLEFDIPANHEQADMITTSNYIMYPVNTNYVLYKVMNIEEDNTEGKYTKHIYCEISAQDDLIKDVVRPVNFNGASLREILTSILSGTDWIVGDVDNFGLQDYKIDDYPTILKAVVDVVSTFGAELNFEYTFTQGSTHLVSQKVSAYKKLGKETGMFFSYGVDLVGVKRTTDRTKLMTAIIAIGKSNSSGDSVTLSGYSASELGDLPDGYTKETANDWIGSTQALTNYGNNGKHIFGVYKDEDASSPTELFESALKTLQQYEKPLMTYDCSVALLSSLTGYSTQAINIGDTVVVQDKTMKPPLYVQARVRKLVRHISDPSKDSVELGDYIPLVPNTNSKVVQLQETIRQKEEAWNAAYDNSNDAIDAANRAEEAANEATEKADEAQALINDLSDDNKLTPVEKKSVKKEWETIIADRLINDAQADVFGIVDEKNDYNTSYNSLETYLTPLLADMDSTSDIVGDTLRSTFKDYYTKRTTLLNAIATKAKQIADSKITGDEAGDIADGAAQDPVNVKEGFNGIIASVYIDDTGLHVENGEITGDVIKGGVIQGALLRTSSTSNYMYFHDQYIDFYNGNSLVMQLGYLPSGGNSYPSLKVYPSQSTGSTSVFYTTDIGDIYSYINTFMSRVTCSDGLIVTGDSDPALEVLGESELTNGKYVFTNDYADFFRALRLNGNNLVMDGGAIHDANYLDLGKNPAYSASVSIASGSYASINHYLGYYPIVSLNGTVGNIILTVQHTSTNVVRVQCYSGGGATWNGIVYCY